MSTHKWGERREVAGETYYVKKCPFTGTETIKDSNGVPILDSTPVEIPLQFKNHLQNERARLRELILEVMSAEREEEESIEDFLDVESEEPSLRTRYNDFPTKEDLNGSFEEPSPVSSKKPPKNGGGEQAKGPSGGPKRAAKSKTAVVSDEEDSKLADEES